MKLQFNDFSLGSGNEVKVFTITSFGGVSKVFLIFDVDKVYYVDVDS